VITDAANVASDELTDWRELANDKSTVSMSWKMMLFLGCELAVGWFSHLAKAIEHAT
jgi:hypothetical protein